MIDRMLDTSLRVALTVAALGSVIMLAVMVLDLFIPARWNWFNALAFFSATTLLAGARFLHNVCPLRRKSVRSDAKHSRFQGQDSVCFVWRADT